MVFRDLEVEVRFAGVDVEDEEAEKETSNGGMLLDEKKERGLR